MYRLFINTTRRATTAPVKCKYAELCKLPHTTNRNIKPTHNESATYYSYYSYCQLTHIPNYPVFRAFVTHDELSLGPIPLELLRLNNLQELDLYHNSLTGEKKTQEKTCYHT